MTMTIIVMKMKVIAVGLRSMMSAESLELTNHRTISKPASTAGPDGKISFLIIIFIFLIFFQLGPPIGCLFFICVSHHVLRILTNLHV